MSNFINRLSRIGVLEDDQEFIVHKKQFVVYEAVLMSGGGLLWGAICLYFNLPYQSAIPLGYVVLSVINLLYFKASKNFGFVRDFQTLISLVLPFAFQWVLGGFIASGAVMLWAILAVAASFSYMSTRQSMIWLTLFAVLTVISGIFDQDFVDWIKPSVSKSDSIILLTLNITVVSSANFALLLFYVIRHANSYDTLVTQANIKLVQSEKMAALGQLSAGIAHEVNTPLAAIKSSAEESSNAMAEVMMIMPEFLSKLTPEQKDNFMIFLVSCNTKNNNYSTREERALKKELAAELDTHGVSNSRFLAEKLVQVGITKVDDQLSILTKYPNFDEVVRITYNLLNQRKNNETIQLAVEKASRVVKALKMYLHTSDSDIPEEMDVHESLETVLTIYHNQLKQGINVTKNFGELPRIMGYPDEINQVWTNLIVNATQAMNYKGELEINSYLEDGKIIVSIKDNGSGIDPKVQNKIFNPFFTTKGSGEGSGIGLDIVKRILDKHKGEISFESELGVGTTFYVKLPIN